MPNRLAAEPSPYLLQHKDNPVDWYPWGEEAFARARAEDKPIFLSIGYSTCHWCHVMEHESFEHADVAGVLNEHFVSIKVDREERPDVDRVYMTFVQATTGSGGWPMSVWLTPALEPFYGGTYFPPTSKWGRPGFVDILLEIARVWREERDKVLTSAATIVERLRTLGAAQAAAGVPGTEVLDRAVREFEAAFDERRGGFGNAPKFPRPSELLFLLREHARAGGGRLPSSRDALRAAAASDDGSTPKAMALTTLRAMALGGMRDHIGGGFHRYSVDGDWRVPHFEKMLYDQAQLVLAYVEAAQVSDEPFYADVALDTLAYVVRDMTDPDGGFYSAEDADSIPPEQAGDPHPHKMEGAFYIWRDEEIGETLGSDAEIFRLRFGVRRDGNAPSDPQQEFVGKNLLYTAMPIDAISRETGRTREEIEAALVGARRRLFERRASRPRPHLDDKVLTAWNGLMIGACARAARTLEGSEEYGEAARRAARFVESRLWRASAGTLLRRYRDGQAGIEGYAEDYAYLIFGLLELFQLDGDPHWLEWAIALQRKQDELFWDEAEAGWFSTTGRDTTVLLRLKEDYDGAEPAATSVSVLNLLTLSHLAEGFEARIAPTLAAFGTRAAQIPRAIPMMLAALSTYHAGMSQLVIVGEAIAAAPFRDEARRRYRPGLITVPVTPATRESIGRILPWVAAMDEKERAAAYVCRDFTCQQPVTVVAELAAQLDQS